MFSYTLKGRFMPFWFFVLIVSVLLFCTDATKGQTTFDWIGNTSSDWADNTNWHIDGAVATSVPTLSTDIVRIGVATTPLNPLTVNNAVTCASIVFGTLNPVSTPPNRTFTVSVNSGASITASEISIVHGSNSATQNIMNNATFIGDGDIFCNTLNIGDAVVPVAASSSRIHLTQLFMEAANFTVTHINLRTTSNTATAVNNATFQLNSGNMVVNGLIKSIDAAYVANNISRFVTDATANNTSLTLNAQVSFTSTSSSRFDFNAGGSGIGTVTYGFISTSTSLYQDVYSAVDNPAFDISPTIYDNIAFAGSGIKRVRANKTISGVLQGLTVAGNWTSGGGGEISLSANNAVAVIGGSLTNNVFVGSTTVLTRIRQGTGSIDVAGNVTNSGTLTLGASPSLFTIAGNYMNSGTYTHSSGTTVFDGAGNQTLNDNSTAGTSFIRVLFTGGGIKTLLANKFFVANTGVLTMSSATTLAANGFLQLRSVAASSASVAPIPAGCAITGNVKVERYYTGSSTDLSKRGYRLISSTVNTASVTIGGTSIRSYTPHYLTIYSPVSGLGSTTNGFTLAGNPTLYLYREDIVPNGATFTSGNYKGIARLNTTTPFAITTQNRLNTAYTSDTTVNIPIGTGILFFFRGNKNNNSSQGGSKTTAPFDFPENVNTIATGVLNQGTVDVRTWYAQADQTKLSFTNTIANDIAPRNVRGYQLVGNPYASTINWNKLNRNTSDVTKSSIYAPAIDPTIWFYNPSNKQFEAYLNPDLTGSDTSNTLVAGLGSASNMIASGQGFFVRANAAGGGMRFLESAKTVTQPVTASLAKLMGIPLAAETGVQSFLHLQLRADTINDDDILIRFSDLGHKDFIPAEDAEDMGGNGALVSLSSFSGDKKSKLAINAMPPVSTIKNMPLFIDASASGLYELHRKELVGIADVYQVWLKDHFTKDSLDFRENDTYAFRIDKSDAATFGSNRFELVFRKKPLPPYELLSFTAENTAEAVVLKWRTLNEFTYASFRVERSDGSSDFISLAELQADGKGNYTFADLKNAGKSGTYRIYQNRPDGSEAYSAALRVNEKIIKPFFLYPNPAAEYINIALEREASARVRVSDSQGKTLFTSFFNGRSASISVSALRAGAYIIEVTDTRSFALLGKEKWIKL